MDKILAPIKQRIIQIIEFKSLKKENFFEKIQSSASNFRSKSLYSEAGGDVIAKILSEFPDINPEWLLTGKGEMLKNAHNITSINRPESNPQEKEIEHLRQLLYEKDKRIEAYEKLIAQQEKEIDFLNQASTKTPKSFEH